VTLAGGKCKPETNKSSGVKVSGNGFDGLPSSSQATFFVTHNLLLVEQPSSSQIAFFLANNLLHEFVSPSPLSSLFC
jgi:hypothetical protein